MALSLRPATNTDDAFSLQVYASTRANEMALVPWSDEQKQWFVEMQFNAQRTSYRQERPNAEWLILMQEKNAVGRMIVDRSDDVIRLMDIALLPEYRNQGIGSKFMNDLIQESRETGKSILLHVEGYNPAFNLYSRMGFKKIGEQSFYVAMEWAPEVRTPF